VALPCFLMLSGPHLSFSWGLGRGSGVGGSGVSGLVCSRLFSFVVCCCCVSCLVSLVSRVSRGGTAKLIPSPINASSENNIHHRVLITTSVTGPSSWSSCQADIPNLRSTRSTRRPTVVFLARKRLSYVERSCSSSGSCGKI
jgi:hypothetical protein